MTTTRSARNDQLADAYLVSALHWDVEGMLVLLVEVARAGGTRGLVDFVDALGAVARDLIEQLGSDQAEALLTRRLLVAAIQEANQHPEWGKIVTVVATKALTERRDELNNQMTTLRSQRMGIAEDLRTVEEDWQAALRASEDTVLLGERRRHREAELTECERAAAQVAEWTAEVEAELRRRTPHEALDRDLADHAREMAASAALDEELHGVHQRAADKVADATLELHGAIAAARERNDRLAARTSQLRATAAQLGRPDPVPGPAGWVQPLEHALRGGPFWRLYLASVQARQPSALVGALAEAATLKITNDRK